MSALRQPVLMTANAGGSATPTHMSVSSAARALTIPSAVLALDLTWSARLVLSEVLDLHRVNGNVFALDDHFADRCRVKKRTVGAAIKELQDAGFLHRETNQSARHKRILTPLIDADGTPRPIAKSAIGLLQNLPQPIAESATDLLQNLPEAIADSADINTNYSFRVNTNETPNPKKMGEGVSKSDSASAESKKVTAPNPVAPPPSPAVAPCLEPGTEESRALGAELAGYWHIRQVKDDRRWQQFATFTRTMAALGRLDEVRQQFAAYKAFRELRGFQRHGIDKILGSESLGYANSVLLHEGDWVAQLAEAQAQAKPRPSFGPAEAPARASASSTRKQSWS